MRIFHYQIFPGSGGWTEENTTHRDVSGIPQQDTPFHCQRALPRAFPFYSTPGLFFLADVPIDCPLLRVDDNPIAVPDKCYWSPQACLGHNMACEFSVISASPTRQLRLRTDDEASGRPREAPIGN
jgi:hypothetical protein